MKTKADKVDKEQLKKDNKNVAKIGSPKNKLTEGLGQFNSERNLIRKSTKTEQKIQSSSEFSESSQSIILEEKEGKKNMKQTANLTKDKVKSVTNPNQVLSPKSQAARFFRSKNSEAAKEQEKVRKLLQEKQIILEDLQRKNEDLQNRVQILSMQKQKTNEIIQQFKQQKEALQKNLQKLKNVAQQNRKLLRQKAEGFNSSSSQIKNLRDQIQELILTKKPSSVSQFGVNTSIEEQKLSQTAYEQKQNISSQMQESNNEITPPQNQFKLEDTQQELNLTNILNGINFEQNLKFSLAVNLFTKIISQQAKTIQQREKTIYELEQELNQFYQSKHRSQILKPTMETSEQILFQVKENQELRESILSKQKKYFAVKEELWFKERELENLRREIQVKDIFYQAEINSRNKLMEHKIQVSPGDAEDLQKQVEQLNKKLSEQQKTIRQLQNKNTQQDLIIKSLKQKKIKIIK